MNPRHDDVGNHLADDAGRVWVGTKERNNFEAR